MLEGSKGLGRLLEVLGCLLVVTRACLDSGKVRMVFLQICGGLWLDFGKDVAKS